MTGLIPIWVADFGAAALILLFALAVGYPLARRILRGPAAVPLMPLTGLAALSAIIALLSWVHLFTALSMVLIAAAAAAASARCIWMDAPGWRAAPRPSLVVCTATAAIVVLGFSWFALYPVITSDATNYHLPLARNLVHFHGLRYDEFVRYSFFPQANEALFAVMQMISKDPRAAGALEYSVLAVVVLALPAWFAGAGRRPGAGLFAAMVVMASPIVIWTGTAPLVDVFTMSFVLAGTLVGLDAAEGRIATVGGFALMGALLGEAAAAKYTALVFGACAAVAVLVAAGRGQRRPAMLLAGLGGAVVVTLPWYAWTIHVTGDPLYPFGTGVFGNRPGLWTSGELALQAESARAIPQTGVGAIFSRDVQYLLGHVLYNTGPDRSVATLGPEDLYRVGPAPRLTDASRS